jgi:hypothetical protein
MLRLFVVLFFGCISFLSKAQNLGIEDFIGYYSGEMLLINQGKNTYDNVDVTLDIHEVKKDSIWTYQMTYNSLTLGTMSKDYEVQLLSGGQLQTDEKNGIVIKMSLIDGCLYEFYESDEMFFTVTLRKNKKKILFELTCVPKWNKKECFLAQETSMTITSYATTVVQKAILKPARK